MPWRGRRYPGTRPDSYELLKTGQKVEAEILPVECDYIPRLWHDIARILQWRGNQFYDLNRLHSRLLLGVDKVWIAVYTRSSRSREICGVIVTHISNVPPSQQKAYLRHCPGARSLTVHLAEGLSIESWIDSAVERLTIYGKENGCHQLFVIARKGWRHYAFRFFGNFERMGYTFDRKIKNDVRRLLARPGFYRPVKFSPRPDRNFINRQRRVAYIWHEVVQENLDRRPHGSDG